MSGEVMDTEARNLEFGSPVRDLKPISLTAVSTLLRLCDVLVVLGVGSLAFFVFSYFDNSLTGGHYIGPMLVAALVASAVFHLSGLYEEEALVAKVQRIDRLVLAWTITVCVLLALAFAFKTTGSYSRLWTVVWVVSTVGVLASVRLFIGNYIGRLAEEGRFAKRMIIVGAGEHGQRLASHLQDHADPYVRVIGFIDDRKDRVPTEVSGHNILGPTNYLLTLIQEGRVDVVVLALPWSAENRLLQLIEMFAVLPVQIRLGPDLVGFNFLDRTTSQIARLPMLRLFDRPISGWSYAVKTIEDRVLALLTLLFLGPLLLLIALAIKLDSPGPALFRQKRFGFNNQPIEVFKFRSMYQNSSNQDGSIQAKKDDPRITRIGRFLRKSSIDELPQILNVLRGDMSIVGPRPHPLALRSTAEDGRHFEEVVDRYAARHRVKPGITGWAQVNGWRGETDTLEKIQKRVEHDLYYIDNWSVWFDLVIISRTLKVIWSDTNAY